MVDTKVSALTELTSLSGDETFYVVDDDDGTPTSKRITGENLIAGVLANPTLTGTVTVPDGALAIADTNGLQAALDAKASLQDPLGFGLCSVTADPSHYGSVGVLGAANFAYYRRIITGGIAISKIGFQVGTSSGNISVAVYTNSGSGRAAAPTGGRLATSGAVACPAAGYREVSLGATITPNRGDWIGLSCDNNTATFGVQGALAATNLADGVCWGQSTAHPLPATPSSLLSRMYGLLLIGVP